jgi:hypothetical protein
MDESKIHRYVTSPTTHTYVVFGSNFPDGYATFYSLKRAQLYAPEGAELELHVRMDEVEPWVRDGSTDYADGYTLGAAHAAKGREYSLPFGKHVNFVRGYRDGFES